MHNPSGATGAAVVATLSVTLAFAGLGLGTFDRDPTELGTPVQVTTPARDGSPLTAASQVPPAPPIEIDETGRPKLSPVPEQLPRPPAPEGIVPADPTEPFERDLFSPMVPWVSPPTQSADQAPSGPATVPPRPSPTTVHTPPGVESETEPGSEREPTPIPSVAPGTSAPVSTSEASISGANPQVDPTSAEDGDSQDRAHEWLCAEPSGWSPTASGRSSQPAPAPSAGDLHRTEAEVAARVGEGVAATAPELRRADSPAHGR